MGCNVHRDAFPRRARGDIATACNRCADRAITVSSCSSAWLRGIRRATRALDARDRRSDARGPRRSDGGCGSSSPARELRGRRGRAHRRGLSRRRRTDDVSAGDVVHLVGRRASACSRDGSGIEVARDELAERGGQLASRPARGATGSAVAVDVRDRLDLAASSTRGTPRQPRRARRSARRAPRRDAGAARARAASPRVTPSRQPAVGGGVTSTPSRTTNTFEPVASHRLPWVFAKIASPAPRASRVRERAHVRRVGDRLQPGERAVLVARPRRDHDVGGRRRRLDRERDEERGRRRPVAAARAGRRGTAGDGDAQARFAQPVRGEHRVGRGAQLVDVGNVETEPVGRRAQARVVTASTRTARRRTRAASRTRRRRRRGRGRAARRARRRAAPARRRSRRSPTSPAPRLARAGTRRRAAGVRLQLGLGPFGVARASRRRSRRRRRDTCRPPRS